MLVRYRALIEDDPERATEYLLNDLDDNSDYLSIQLFTDNAVNPCLESTYAFVDVLLTEVIRIHEDIQPLETFHFGGDEVPEGAWVNSTACKILIEEQGYNTTEQLKKYFATRVAQIARDRGVSLSAWEDGLMVGNEPYERSEIQNDHVTGYCWDSVWEWGKGSRPYRLANENYTVRQQQVQLLLPLLLNEDIIGR